MFKFKSTKLIFKWLLNKVATKVLTTTTKTHGVVILRATIYQRTVSTESVNSSVNKVYWNDCNTTHLVLANASKTIIQAN